MAVTRALIYNQGSNQTLSFVADRDFTLTGVVFGMALNAALAIGLDAAPLTNSQATGTLQKTNAVAFYFLAPVAQTVVIPLSYLIRKGQTVTIQSTGTLNGSIFLSSSS